MNYNSYEIQHVTTVSQLVCFCDITLFPQISSHIFTVLTVRSSLVPLITPYLLYIRLIRSQSFSIIIFCYKPRLVYFLDELQRFMMSLLHGNHEVLQCLFGFPSFISSTPRLKRPLVSPQRLQAPSIV